MYRFRNKHSAAIDPSLVDDALEARRNQVLVPLLSVAPDAETRAAIGDLSQGERSTEGDDIKRRHVGIIRELVEQGNQKGVPIKVVAEALRASGQVAYANIEPRYVGALLRRTLGLSTAKRHGVFVVLPEEINRVLPMAGDGYPPLTEAADSRESPGTPA